MFIGMSIVVECLAHLDFILLLTRTQCEGSLWGGTLLYRERMIPGRGRNIFHETILLYSFKKKRAENFAPPEITNRVP